MNQLICNLREALVDKTNPYTAPVPTYKDGVVTYRFDLGLKCDYTVRLHESIDHQTLAYDHIYRYTKDHCYGVTQDYLRELEHKVKQSAGQYEYDRHYRILFDKVWESLGVKV